MIHTNGNSYTEVRNPDRSRSAGVLHHRLIAFGMGEIESLSDGREVHHKNRVPWLNYPENIEAVDPTDHRVKHAATGRSEA